MATFTTIDRNSTFPITVGGNTLVHLQKLVLFIVADKTPEELALAGDKIRAQQWDEDWYEHLAFLSTLIVQMEAEARDRNLLIQEELKDDDTTQQDS